MLVFILVPTIGCGTPFASPLPTKRSNDMRNTTKGVSALLIGSLTLGPLVGCESLPGDKETQGAVIGGVGGALAGGALAKDNRLLGALIGGAVGAGGGWLIGSQL